ncbi:MAG: efflux RND transporter periplasmic adaptor subunit [Burkholderiales bacterium]|nr:efflux RND transporter periplasmic adaptor subunit [Burkholderiales bacterium]
MKPRTKRIAALATAAGVALFATALAFTGAARSNAKPVAAPAPIELAPADLVTAERRELKRAIPLTGSLQARNQTVVKAKVAGEIRELLVREGEPVRAGQVVARIDATEAESRVAEKVADLEAARAQAELAEKNRANQEKLLAQGFISQNAFDSTLSNVTVSQARQRAAAAQLALARKALEDTIVRAPIAGVVAQRLAQPGERVAVDGKILTLVDLAELEVEAAVPAGDIPAIRVGQEVTFTVEGFEGRTFTGRIDRIAPAAIGGSRSILVYAVLPNRDGALRAGMFAKGGVTLDKRAAAWVLPLDAIHEGPEGAYVYRLAEGTLARVPVGLGLRDEAEGTVEVVAGIDGPAEVVKASLGALREGVPVRVAGAAR